MSWLHRLFRPPLELDPEIAERVRAWYALAPADDRQPLDEVRLVVVDVETTGLDARRDRLLSIGAVVIKKERLAPQHTFSAVLCNRLPTRRENVVVHGLTPTVQAAGEPRERVLSEFLTFIGKSPCVAFHAEFDRIVLDRALRAELGVRLTNPWIDLAQLAPALYPEARLVHGALDDWLAYFRLRVHARHDAVHDAHVAAELLLILLARAKARGISTLAQLRAAAHVHMSYHRG